MHVMLVDGSSFIFRAFYSLPPLTRPSDGHPIGAVHGFCSMLMQLLSRDASHIAVVFDAGRRTFRHDIYPEYKSTRQETPPELRQQFTLIRDAVKAFNIACLEQNGYEADDLIATYARHAVERDGEVVIVSSDKDFMQLVRPGVTMLDTMKNKSIGHDEVLEKFGVPPDKVIDVQALMGDATDNVPGIHGIGVKTAAALIQEFGDLDTLLANAARVEKPKLRTKIIELGHYAKLSRRLVRLEDNVPVSSDLDSLVARPVDTPALLKFAQRMELVSLHKAITDRFTAPCPTS